MGTSKLSTSTTPDNLAMLTRLKELLQWAFHLLLDAGKAALILAGILSVLGLVVALWLEGASLTVVNQSGGKLVGVTLLTGHPQTGIDEIWRKDLSPDETAWSYTFTGKDRAVVRYMIGETSFEAECLYESEGLGVSAEMTINPNGELTCKSWLRI